MSNFIGPSRKLVLYFSLESELSNKSYKKGITCVGYKIMMIDLLQNYCIHV